MPTSLTYIIPSTRGCSPRRPAADIGTTQRDYAVTSPEFSRSRRPLLDAARTATLFAGQRPFLPAKGFQGHSGLCRKDNSSQSFDGRLPVDSCCHDEKREVSSGYATEFGNINPTPFRPTAICHTYVRTYIHTYIHRHLTRGLPQALGSTDPCPTAVHMEPFSTSVLQGLSGVFATTTKIYTGRGSSRAYARQPSTPRPRPSYSSTLRRDDVRERTPPTLRIQRSAPTVGYEWSAEAPSIFRANCFGR